MTSVVTVQPPRQLPRCRFCSCHLTEQVDGKTRLRLKHRHFAVRPDGDAEMLCPDCHQLTTFPARRLLS